MPFLGVDLCFQDHGRWIKTDNFTRMVGQRGSTDPYRTNSGVVDTPNIILNRLLLLWHGNFELLRPWLKIRSLHNYSDGHLKARELVIVDFQNHEKNLPTRPVQ